MSTPETPYLKFKYLKNQRINLGDEHTYQIPSEMREQLTPAGAYAVMPFFFMDTVFNVKLQDEQARLPVKGEYMSESMYQKLCDEAYTVALQAKKFNDGVRKMVAHYVKDKTIEVIEDPFTSETETDYERTKRESDAKKAADKPVQTVKPIDSDKSTK